MIVEGLRMLIGVFGVVILMGVVLGGILVLRGILEDLFSGRR